MSDAQWIHEREALQFMSGRFYIYDRAGNVCPNPELDLRPWEDPLHAGAEDYRDAAEFEARVAAKLAGGRPWWGCSTRCPWNRMDLQDTLACRFERLGQKFCALRDARCAVEEEMDNGNNA